MSEISRFVSRMLPVRGSGILSEETRQLEAFHGVVLNTSGDLYIRVGEEESIRIQAEDNILPLIETVIQEGILRIGMKANISLTTTKPFTYTLTVKQIDHIQTNSSGDVDVPSLKVDQLKLISKGSGVIETEQLEANELITNQISSGNIVIEALSAGRIKSEIKGSGDLMVNQGQVKEVDLRLTSAGNCFAPAVGAFDDPGNRTSISISGSGDVDIGALNGNMTGFRLVSAGKLKVGNLQSHDLKARVSGSGDLKVLNGRITGAQKIELLSSGKYLAGDLVSGTERAETISIKVSGSGSAFPGQCKAENVAVILHSAGEVIVRGLDAISLQAAVKGSGHLGLESGTACELDVNLTSAGGFKAANFLPGEQPGKQAVIRISGSGSARIGGVSADVVNLKTTSSGTLQVEKLSAEALSVSLTGSGDIKVNGGEANSQKVRLTSAGNYKAANLSVKICEVKSSGSGDVIVNPKERLDARILSSGNIVYYGKPIVSYTSQGSGILKQEKLAADAG